MPVLQMTSEMDALKVSCVNVARAMAAQKLPDWVSDRSMCNVVCNTAGELGHEHSERP